MRWLAPQYVGIIYFISELLLTITHRTRGTGGVRQDRGTLRVLWLVIMASIIAGVYVARHWAAAAVPHPQTFAIIGVLLLFVPGLFLRWWSIITLGRFFTVDVTIAKDHELVESGPFRVVRHPSYTGVLLAFLGFALTLGNWAGMLLVLVPISIAFGHRMNVEERALTAALDDRYVAYMQRTKRLVPFVY